MRFGQRRVIELNLHVDNVGDTRASDRRHVFRRPNTAT
jgi:hypothetical protein